MENVGVTMLRERRIYKNFISHLDSQFLIRYGQSLYQNPPPRNIWKDKDFSKISIVTSVAARLEQKLELKIKKGNSFWWIRNYNNGVVPHYDTGNNQHMQWCNLSCSILLSPPDSFSGGVVRFHDGGTVTPRDHHLSALVYSSKESEDTNKHWVEKCPFGDRWMLLMFFEAVY